MTQRSLIAVVNARSRQNTWANAVRNTWLTQMPSTVDAKFFVGRGSEQVPNDTVALDCDDSYAGLPNKVQEITRYAEKNGYDYVMKLDDDVVIKPKALLASGYDQHPYSGRANRRPTDKEPYWVPMGFAYWLNKQCMSIVSAASLPMNNDDERWVAENLNRHGIALHDDRHYHLYTGGLLDRPQRTNRPLRVGRALQDDSRFDGGFAWCVFFEVGGLTQRIPVEEKIKEFNRLHQKYGEPRL